MKNKTLVILGILCLLVLSGCNSLNFLRGEPNITGYVMATSEDSILVVNTEPEDFSGAGGIEEFYDAVWVSNVTETVDVGEQVNVWFEGGVDQSYPAQAGMGELEIMDSRIPDGADLSEAEALRFALSQESLDPESLVVRSISFDDNADEWVIELRDIHSYEDYTIQIDDQGS